MKKTQMKMAKRRFYLNNNKNNIYKKIGFPSKSTEAGDTVAEQFPPSSHSSQFSYYIHSFHVLIKIIYIPRLYV